MTRTTRPPLTLLSLMSGTSADGVDAVLATFELADGQLRWEVLDRLSRPYSSTLRGRVLACLRPDTSDVRLLTQVHAEIGRALRRGWCRRCAGGRSMMLDLMRCALSGQTVYHIPRQDEKMVWQTPSTLQLGEAAIVAEASSAPVVSDFRQGDMAAGGQGAPLVAFGDYLLFNKIDKARAVHNLGGISQLDVSARKRRS